MVKAKTQPAAEMNKALADAGVPPAGYVKADALPKQATELTYHDDNKELYQTILTSLRGEGEPELEMETADYIMRICNADARMGNLNWFQYREILLKSVDGLHSLIYIKHYTPDVGRRDPLFASSLVLLSELLTRVFQGRDYNLEGRRVDAKGNQPIIMNR